MNYRGTKEWFAFIACVLGALVGLGVFIAVLVGIPAAALVWIIETIKN